MKINFDEIIDRSHTASMKWGKYENQDIIPMWVADMDFKAPEPVRNMLQQKLDHGVFGYTDVPDELNTVIAEHLDALYQWQVQQEWIVWTPGVVSAFNVACAICGGPFDKIVTTVPVYPPFLTAPSNQGKLLSTVPMVEVNNRHTLDFEALDKEFGSSQAALFIFCSPYNPCGTVFTRQEISQLAALCDAHNVVICSDEIHCDFILDPGKKHIPTATVSKTALNNTITLMAPSKTYNIPGLGCSFAVIPDDDLRKRFIARSRGLIPDVNLLGLFAAQAAYTSCGEWLSQLIEYLRGNRDLVLDRVNQMPGCRVNPIESTYLAWIDMRSTGIDDPVGFFEKAGVGLSDGHFFGQDGFVRLNYGCPRSVLDKGLTRMEKALM